MFNLRFIPLLIVHVGVGSAFFLSLSVTTDICYTAASKITANFKTHMIYDKVDTWNVLQLWP